MTIPTAADVDAAVKKQSARENDSKGIIDIPLLKTLLKNIVSSIGSAITGDVPVGGTTGQVLTKASNADLDAGWETPADVSALTISVTELIAGLNALLLYLDISPAVLVDDDGNVIVDDNGNLIIG